MSWHATWTPLAFYRLRYFYGLIVTVTVAEPPALDVTVTVVGQIDTA